MSRLILAVILSLMAWMGASPAGAAEAGRVVRVKGEAQAAGRSLAQGDPVQEGETVTTGPDARLELLLGDQSRLTIGEKARITIDRLVFDPETSAGQARLDLAQGAFRLVTGAIAKLPEKPYQVRTAVATIGIRGTDFWGGPLDGTLFNLFLIEGAVTIETGGGRTDLTQSGQGSAVAAPGAPPSDPVFWSDAKVGRALATISFEAPPAQPKPQPLFPGSDPY